MYESNLNICVNIMSIPRLLKRDMFSKIQGKFLVNTMLSASLAVKRWKYETNRKTRTTKQLQMVVRKKCLLAACGK